MRFHGVSRGQGSLFIVFHGYPVIPTPVFEDEPPPIVLPNTLVENHDSMCGVFLDSLVCLLILLGSHRFDYCSFIRRLDIE